MAKDSKKPVNIDELITNADWPKRTPDTMDDIDALIAKHSRGPKSDKDPQSKADEPPRKPTK